MAQFIIDTWPVLEWLQDKAPAAQKFEQFVDAEIRAGSRLFMSRINYGEVTYSLSKPRFMGKGLVLLPLLRRLPLELLSVDDALIDEAATLKAKFPISYADAFAAAQAIRLNAPLVTGDKEFLELERASMLRVIWLGA